jgi:tetratricopeptide (TPR) repeat protein
MSDYTVLCNMLHAACRWIRTGKCTRKNLVTCVRTVMLVGVSLALCSGALAERRARAEHRRSAPRQAEASAAGQAWSRSRAAEEAGHLEAALAALDELPQPQRSGYAALFRRGWLHYRLAHHDQALIAYKAASLLNPDSIEARLAMLLPLMAQERWAEVAVIAEQVLRRDPDDYLALSRLAFAKFSSQHYPEAEAVYRRVVELYPSDIEMRAGLGWAVLRMGKQPEAAALFREVLDMSPEHESATAGLRLATAPPRFLKYWR